MTLPRRRFLHLAAGAVTSPMLYTAGRTQGVRPLAERLADYAYRLRYEDLDAATIERVKVHTIDSIGCAIAAFDEKPVRICREVALASGENGATVIGTRRRAVADLATFANCAAIRYRSNVGQRWSTAHTDAVLRALWALDRTDNLSALLANLALPA